MSDPELITVQTKDLAAVMSMLRDYQLRSKVGGYVHSSQTRLNQAIEAATKKPEPKPLAIKDEVKWGSNKGIVVGIAGSCAWIRDSIIDYGIVEISLLERTNGIPITPWNEVP